MKDGRRASMDGGRKRWRKILYEQQTDYADNFSGPEFLQEMRKNVTAETYSWAAAVRGSLCLMVHLDVVAVFALFFFLCETSTMDWRALLCVCSIAALAGFFLLLALTAPSQRRRLLRDNASALLVFVCFGGGLSPVFRTLTETISTDTIYAMATCMFLLSVAFHDYGVDAPIVSSPLSLNLAMFGAVCLVSRLPSSNHSFALLSLAVLLFAQWPRLRSSLIARWPSLHVLLLPVLGATVLVSWAWLSLVAAALLLLLHVFICVVCPYWLMLMQPLKSTIHGPWDEAVIKDS